MTILRNQHKNPVRNEWLAVIIIAEFTIEWQTMKNANGSKRNGCQYRARNRLVREAGFDYNEAYYAIHDASA